MKRISPPLLAALARGGLVADDGHHRGAARVLRGSEPAPERRAESQDGEIRRGRVLDDRQAQCALVLVIHAAWDEHGRRAREDVGVCRYGIWGRSASVEMVLIAATLNLRKVGCGGMQPAVLAALERGRLTTFRPALLLRGLASNLDQRGTWRSACSALFARPHMRIDR